MAMIEGRTRIHLTLALVAGISFFYGLRGEELSEYVSGVNSPLDEGSRPSNGSNQGSPTSDSSSYSPPQAGLPLGATSGGAQQRVDGAVAVPQPEFLPPAQDLGAALDAVRPMVAPEAPLAGVSEGTPVYQAPTFRELPQSDSGQEDEVLDEELTDEEDELIDEEETDDALEEEESVDDAGL